MQTVAAQIPVSKAVRPPPAARAARGRNQVVCHAIKDEIKQACQQLACAGVAAMLSLAPMSGVAVASDLDVLNEPTPTAYYIDDASVLSKSTKGDLTQKLKTLEITTGYRLEVVTVRKLEFESDAFSFGDKVLEKWYPTVEQGNKKGILAVITTAKEGAVVGGPAFLEALGEDLVEDIVTNNIPIYTEEEKYNQTVLSSVERISAKLNGEPVPDGPTRADNTRKRTYKTKEETDNSKGVTGTVVGTLLFIAVVVPMLQYYGYTSRD